MIKVPTVDDWFALTLKYREYHRVSHTVLKDYGYMAIIDYLDNSPGAKNILEFGHAFNSTIFERYEKTRNVWGIDECQGLSYFTTDQDEWEKRFDNEVRVKAPNCTYRRGLLGSKCTADLPNNFFDVICSVSVLEEVPRDMVRDILKHASRLLKPGGALIGTHDHVIDFPARIGEYVAAHAEAGLDLQDPYPRIGIGSHTLFESPTTAMLWYQAHEGETRKYWGHWTTIWTIGCKLG